MLVNIPDVNLEAARRSDWAGGVLLEAQPAGYAPGLPGKYVGEFLHRETADGAHRLIVSLGKAEKVNAAKYRKAGQAAGIWLVEHGAALAGIDSQAFAEVSTPGALKAFVEGVLLGAFRFEVYKSEPLKPPAITLRLLGEDDLSGLGALVLQVRASTNGANLARYLAHQPANVINPLTLAEYAQELAQVSSLRCMVIDQLELEQMGAGAILAVGQGSQTGSRLIVLEHPGSGATEQAPVVVVGKAITFDTGGYSIKDTTGMVGMKFDKCGAAAVLGLMQAVAALELPIRVIGLIAAAENMISAQAYRPNDILRSLSGKTIEIISTDAEGRLVLADALAYAQQNFKPRALIDVATLTGGIVVSLGKVRAGLMSNNDKLAKALLAAGERTQELLWPMPLDDEYFELIRSEDADMKNSAGIRQAHPVIGGLFLKQFVADEVPWAHLDIAGTATREKELRYVKIGATGFGVHLLLDYLQHLD